MPRSCNWMLRCCRDPSLVSSDPELPTSGLGNKDEEGCARSFLLLLSASSNIIRIASITKMSDCKAKYQHHVREDAVNSYHTSFQLYHQMSRSRSYIHPLATVHAFAVHHCSVGYCCPVVSSIASLFLPPPDLSIRVYVFLAFTNCVHTILDQIFSVISEPTFPLPLVDSPASCERILFPA